MGARTIAWGRCTPLTIVDQFGIIISSFTPSFEVLGRLLKNKKKKKKEDDDENSKIALAISCEKTKVCVDSWAVPMARERSVSDVCEVLALGWSFRGEL